MDKNTLYSLISENLKEENLSIVFIDSTLDLFENIIT
jgi:hypothetical protein